MGLRGINDADDSKLSTFAEDILKIEINGPDVRSTLTLSVHDTC